MTNQLENKAALKKSINAKYNNVTGLCISRGTGTGTGTGEVVVQPLLSASCLRCFSQTQGFAAFILEDKNMSGS